MSRGTEPTYYPQNDGSTKQRSEPTTQREHPQPLPNKDPRTSHTQDAQDQGDDGND